MTITIKTRLDAGIYKSQGGGECRTHHTFATGPRNLLRAIRTLREHRREMEIGYGNIGCGGSWLEIDGVRIDDLDLECIALDESIFKHPDGPRVKTATEKARDFLRAA